MAPLAKLLARHGVARVVLIPVGLLAQQPLHAVPIDTPEVDVLFLDRVVVSYAPSAQVLRAVREAVRQRAGQSASAPFFAGIGGQPDAAVHLHFAELELRHISCLFGPNARLLLGRSAQRAALGTALQGAQYIHFASHGYADPLEPLNSRLLLAGNDVLTLRDVRYDSTLEALRSAKLVVLSACHSATIEQLRLPNELIGLPTGFLQAGASCVLGTLWAVDDLSTALLMARFYEIHLGPAQGHTAMDPARALQEAQRWLRGVTAEEIVQSCLELAILPGAITNRSCWSREMATQLILRFGLAAPDARPFCHPRHWAPFIIMGA